MYSLEINFLKDRPEFQAPSAAPRAAKAKVPIGEKVPMYIGIGIGLALPALAGGLVLLINQQGGVIEEQQAAREKELAEIQTKIKQVEAIKARIQEVKNQTSSVTGVFNEIRPWSALIQDIRNRTSTNMQITEIKELAPQPGAAPPPRPSPSPSPSPSPGSSPKAASPSPAASPTPSPTPQAAIIEIKGTARTPNEVNLFLLNIQRSPFFSPEPSSTRIVVVREVRNPARLVQGAGAQGNIQLELPNVIEYTIQTRLNNNSASQLIGEMERLGVVGLPTRIRTIQQIQQQGGDEK